MSRSAEKAREVVVHASKIFLDTSLDTKIRLIPILIDFEGDHKASPSGLKEWSSSIPEKYLKRGTIHVLLTYGLHGGLGVAKIPSVCDSNNR